MEIFFLVRQARRRAGQGDYWCLRFEEHVITRKGGGLDRGSGYEDTAINV